MSKLREELRVRDELVQQLSRELFRLVKGNPIPRVTEGAPTHQHHAEVRALREQLQSVEEQVTFYQGQLEERNTEIAQLKQTVHELTDRTRMLEQVVQELPKVYRQKFEARIESVRDRVRQLQQQNRQMQAELQSVSYRLAVRTRRSQRLELPSFSDNGMERVGLPSF